MSATRLLAGMLGMVMALPGCASHGPPQERTDGSCFIGGCSGEVCSGSPEVITPCTWDDAYVCLREATCARQPDGACGWVPTPELRACLASHEPQP